MDLKKSFYTALQKHGMVLAIPMLDLDFSIDTPYTIDTAAQHH